eukprot:g2872.t1
MPYVTAPVTQVLPSKELKELPEGTSGSPPAAEPAPADVPADVTATGEEVTGEAEQEAAEAEDGPKTKRAQSLRARVLAELGSSSAEEVKQRLVKELEEEGRKVASAKAIEEEKQTLVDEATAEVAQLSKAVEEATEAETEAVQRVKEIKQKKKEAAKLTALKKKELQGYEEQLRNLLSSLSFLQSADWCSRFKEKCKRRREAEESRAGEEDAKRQKIEELMKVVEEAKKAQDELKRKEKEARQQAKETKEQAEPESVEAETKEASPTEGVEVVAVKREISTPVPTRFEAFVRRLRRCGVEVLMKHGTFIHLDELDQAAWLGTEPEPEGRVALRAPVWTRPRLAAQLGVSEEVLPMAAALCGNDHSRELIDRCRKRGLPGPNGAALSDEFGALAKLLQSLTEGGASPEVPLAAEDSSMFEDKVKMFSKHEDLLQLHQWPTWRRLASLRQALSEAIPSSGVEATSTQEGGACSVRDLHWWALRFTATSTHLKLHQAEFDALAACSLLLMHRPAEPTRQGPGATRASWRCLCLGFWFQKVIADIYDLAMIMKVAPETAHPSRLFDGPTFWQLLQLYQCPASTAQSAASAAAGSARRARGKMGFRGSPSDVKSMGNSEEERLLSGGEAGEFLKLRESSTFRAWRQEVLEGLAVALVKPELGTAPLRARRNESGAAPAPAAAAAGRPALKGLPIEQHKERTGEEVKSTQVPQYLLELFPDAQVAVTQPRRMAAINLAKRVAAERHEVLGQTVGYRIGGDSLVGSQLNFQTTGWLLRALVSDTNRLGRLTHVVFDEIHERSADADFLSLVARLLLHRFPQVNLVIMSATLQANLFRTLGLF